MAKARDAAQEASDNYEQVLQKALVQFNKVKELYPGQTFWVWAAATIHLLASPGKNTQGALFLAMAEYFGPDAGTIAGYIDKLRNATTSSIILPG